MRNHVFVVLLLAGVAAPAAAQVQQQIVLDKDMVEKQVAGEGGPIRRQLRIVGNNMRDRVAVEAKITAGAPYSADAVTESTQTLADGNRINRKVTTRVYRDGE